MGAEREALLRLGRTAGEADERLEARVQGGFAMAAALTGAPLAATVREGVAADVQVGRPGERPRYVVVNGEVVVRDGTLVRADLEELRAKAHEAAPLLWQRLGALPYPA